MKQRGFTLIEVTFAVLILALSMTVLLGLQTTALRSSYTELFREKASTAALFILEAMDHFQKSGNSLKEEEKEGDILSVAGEYLEIDGENKNFLQSYFSGLKAHLSSVYQTLPDVESPNPLLAIKLTISWGPSSADEFRVSYLLPIKGQDEKDTEEEEEEFENNE
ncbi:MAG: prepilin-type N-terminal cleavage/methylation domain-containing protein [Candidatus Dadabacteria bacterium]|nr:MAG: prepilin-type N-terminal cleavage/methylation domain-containing protein [Candidatus Dadabacteria bacterium]